MSQNSRGLDWLHCNHCFKTGGQMGAVFFTSCGHVLCQKCGTNQGTPASTCPVCKVAARLVAVDKNLGPDIRIFFQKPYDVASHYMQQLKKVLDFQMTNRQHLQKYQQERTMKMQKYAETTGGQFKKMQDAAKQLYQEKQQLIEETKNYKQQIQQLKQRCSVAEAKIRNRESRLEHLQPSRGSDSGHSSLSMLDYSSHNSSVFLTSTPVQGSTTTSPANLPSRNDHMLNSTKLSPIARTGPSLFSSTNSSHRQMSQEVIDDGPLAVLNKLFKNEQEDADDYILVDDDTPQQEDLLLMSTQNIEASCGKVKGVLLLDLFRCPGIHSPCIMVNGGLHTPKEFVVMAGKDKQKDWKGSIRIAGETIRQMMDTKTLDFAQHETDCSGKCGKGRAMELATCLQFLNKLPAAGFPTNGFLPMMPAGATVPTPSPQLNLTHTKLDFIPSDVTQQNLQNIMVKEPMRFFTELHQMGLLSQILNNLASALESTNDEEPLPTSFSHTFAPALFCALSTFNLLPEVFEMIKQKKDFLSQSVQFETVSSTNHTLETSTSQNINAKEESL